FSTFMMWLLAAVYHHLPEVGDPDKPKLVFFLDEAHLLFENSNQSFLDQIEMVARLIRSKGVGVYFVTQSPEDVPPKVLAQLGNRVQHALRAFTPDDQKMITDTARTFPTTTDYDVARELVSLGTGEGLVTVLSPRGVPTPTVHVMLRPPRSLMAQIDPAVFSALVSASSLATKYAADQDPPSAKEMLAARLAAAQAAAAQAASPTVAGQAGGAAPTTRPAARPAAGFDLEDAAKLGTRVLTSSTTNTIMRGLFGILSGKK
ncbi:MAG: helicase HerA-like domain-containing protein, partial [Candidatus Limnocylindrales bacterium]